jgi:hypothetical protein
LPEYSYFSAPPPGALGGGESTRAHPEPTVWQKQTLDKLQKQSYHMERVMHASLTNIDPTVRSRLRLASTPRERAHILIASWKSVYTRVSDTYRNPPFLAALTCIHRGEGTWNDMRNPTYDGGLQINFTDSGLVAARGRRSQCREPRPGSAVRAKPFSLTSSAALPAKWVRNPAAAREAY